MSVATMTAPTLYDIVEQVARDLYIRALKDMPPDVRRALQRAYEKEQSERARFILRIINRNIELADERSLLVCQDTGTPVYFVGIGTEVELNPVRFEEAIRRGTARAKEEHPFRSSIVTPLSRESRPTGTGYRIPVVHYDFIDGADYVELLMVPKGSGSENMSYFRMLPPAEGREGVKRFVLESVVQSGANPCPPVIVGVGLGGTADLAMVLAKRAIARSVEERNPDSEMAQLENELLEAINSSGIGPQGLGGIHTALAVNVEHADTHISSIPVAVNIQCWAARRARARIWADGRVEWGY